MSIYIGNNKYKEIYLGSNKISEVYLGSNKIFAGVDPYNPLGLPPNTVRVRTDDGNRPGGYMGTPSYTTATLVPGTTNVYDVYKSGTNFRSFLYGCTNLVEVLGANTTGITNMGYMFTYCFSLATVPLFDTTSVTNMYGMFESCKSLTAIPLFNTSKVTNMSSAFESCSNVETGALALYQQASTQATPPTNHTNTFYYCGSNTTTGAAELAQIPSSWGGTGA